MKKKQLHSGFKRVLCLALTLVMLLSLMPMPHAHAEGEGTTLYLKPSTNWMEGGVRFAMYYFEGGESGWTDMSDTDGDGYYEGILPAGYSTVIFCRMDPNAPANEWVNKRNQTDDLPVPTDGANCFAVTEGTWDKGGGTWSVYTPAQETEASYYVAGSSALCGSEWIADDAKNVMTRNADGKYEKVYEDVAAGAYEFKITDGTWVNSWGDNGGNYKLTLAETSKVTITFDADTKAITVATEAAPVVDYYLIGYINGANYGCEEDYTNLGEYKFVEGKLTATFAQDSYVFVKTGDNENWYMAEAYCETDSVVLKNTSTGASQKMFVPANKELVFTLAENEDGTLTLSYAEKQTEPEVPAVDYYLVGSINGADYGINADAANDGEYKFVDGKLTVTFTQESYVFVKTGGSKNWYMADAYCTGTSVTLKDTSTGTSEKMLAPANVELNFTLVENEDGSLTLSYALPEEITPIAVEKIIAAGNGADLGGGKWLNGKGWAPGDDANAMTEVAENVFEIVYKDVPRDKGYQVKFAANGGWDNLANWGGTFQESGAVTEAVQGGGNITFDILHETADVTLRLDLSKCDANTKTGATFTITIEGKGELVYVANLYFQKPEGWGETVYAWIWQGSGKLPGYEEYGENWPGKAVPENTHNPGWYAVQVEVEQNSSFDFIFSDGSNDDGKKTGDLNTGVLDFVTNIWIVNGELQRSAPSGWVDPYRRVFVPGSFPGPNWDAASNEMTYDPTLGLYVYTFKNVPAANYEYKIALNGTWGENYGKDGYANGENMAVAVPEDMDVTVYYNDRSHRSVTSVSYRFVEVLLSGTGIPEGTRLLDQDLTGIYSVTLDLTAGTYEGVQLACGEDAYDFAPFTLTEDKAVTFYFDPDSGLYYHDGADKKVDGESIFFDSQDEAYKAPFGAVATGEEVTFTIITGEDATAVKLMVQNHGSFDMEKVEAKTREMGVQKWTCTVSFDTIGEYHYYFAIANGGDMKVYGDDDGLYGKGQVTDLTSVKPYDLVVYQAGFETPDWMKNAVIYQIFPDRFFDGDATNNQAQTWARGETDYEYISHWYTLPENPQQEEENPDAYPSNAHKGDGVWSNEIYGGDLQGIIQRIDYLEALGVNVIYLNPVFWSISNHRYDAVDYTEIDPILGDLGDFEELVAAAEAHGMHIILDGVFNHVSDDSVYFDRYYRFLDNGTGKIGAYPYWAYVYDFMAENEVDQAAAEAAAREYFTAEYQITDYSYTEWFAVRNEWLRDGKDQIVTDDVGLRAGKGVYSYEGWWGYDSMPVIKSTNGSEYRTGNWAEEIIYSEDGSSVTQYWITKGNNGWRLDVANEVSDETWQNFRASVKALDSDAVIIGEIWTDATEYLMGDMYDSVMNYQFRNTVTEFAMGQKDGAAATSAMERIRERYPEEAFYAMMNLVGSHDTSRLLSYLDGVKDDRDQKDPAHAFPSYEATSDVAKRRQYVVAFLQFTYAGAPTIYYGDEIGMVGADDPDDRRAMEWGKGNKELVEWYAKLAAIREAYPALRTGDIGVIDTGNAHLMGYSRSLNGQTLIVVANNSGEEQTFTMDNSAAVAYTDVISGKAYGATKSSYTVPAYSGIILAPAEDVKTVSVDLAGLAPAYDPSYVVADRPAQTEAHTHVYGEGVVVEPTCEKPGYTEYTCECGYSYKDDYVEATGHSYTEAVTGPTCTEDGYTTYTCACGHSYQDNFVDATGHDYEEKVTPATCTEGGMTTLVCKNCGECLISTEEEPLGHDFQGGECSRCGEDDPNSEPMEPVKPGWSSWWDKIFGGWWGDRDDKPTEPSVPETTEPEVDTEPTVPAKPVEPSKPVWGGIFDWFRNWWR